MHDPYVMSRTYESQTRKAQAEETRRRILRALIDLLVEERPATISIPQVARRAGVSVRIVYHYFPTKDALFDSLTQAMPTLVTLPDGDAPRASTPAELVALMPALYRYLEANRPVFRAIRVSEFGDRMGASRRPERVARMDTALEPMQERLDDDAYRKVRAVVGVLASFDGYEALTTEWGLTRGEAAEAAAWAVRTLCDRARRSGVGG